MRWKDGAGNVVLMEEKAAVNVSSKHEHREHKSVSICPSRACAKGSVHYMYAHTYWSVANEPLNL